MIYLSDDYLNKYIDVFGYIFARGIEEEYSLPYIEKVVAYSSFVDELEKSNITTIAFSSSEKIYHDLFPLHDNSGFIYNPYDQFGWMGNVYIHLFLKYEITFELLFIILPLKKALSLYKLYHEMDYSQIYSLFDELMGHSYLDAILKNKNISSMELSRRSGVSFPTINALRYKQRDISKLEAKLLFKLAKSLNVKITTLLPSLDLERQIL